MRADLGKALYFEDAAVGLRFARGGYLLTEAEIKEFAGRYDPQPFHLDEEAAKRSPLGGLAASGWHTASITMRLLVESGIFAGKAVGAGGEIEWPRPARPGDILGMVAEIVAVRPSRSKPDRGVVTFRIETSNQRGELVQRFTSKVMVFRRGATG